MPSTKKISQLPLNNLALKDSDVLLANIDGTTVQTPVSSLNIKNIKSPNGTIWTLSVDNSGILSLTPV